MPRHDVKDAPAGIQSAHSAQTDDVARFYENLVFPSRGSHPDYLALLPAQRGLRLGDFGCGQSIFHEALRGYTPTPTFLDLSFNALRTIDHGGRVRADLRALPFPTATFDRIFCIGVLHHLEDRSAVWPEIARILKPGGRFIVGVYAPGSLQARLRLLHDASRARAWRALMFGMTEALIGARYAKRGLPRGEVRLRTRDFLDVPYVLYAAPELYANEARGAGLVQSDLQRIAGMNVLTLDRGRGEAVRG